MEKKIIIFTRDDATSKNTERILRKKLDNTGYIVTSSYCPDADLLVCIGGDGTFLEAIHKFDFPGMPIIGINTGHLGFFQEIMPAKMDDFIFNFSNNKYSLQPLSTVKIQINTKSGETYEHIGLNEVIIKNSNARTVHLNMSIGGSFIERYSGDGILVATPAGSTAYNYSLGGSIVDPRLNLLQVTPMAPMNTTAYRSFTSSVLLPSELSLDLIPDMYEESSLSIIYDGFRETYDNARSLTVSFSDIKVNLLRFEGYDFWTKVKSKFL
ncbi:MAG: NAD(+)/NADH kinase [Clostridiales bacterium]|nr:NAD(+)/NADH kinase [Clostridiales bacterium]